MTASIFSLRDASGSLRSSLNGIGDATLSPVPVRTVRFQSAGTFAGVVFTPIVGDEVGDGFGFTSAPLPVVTEVGGIPGTILSAACVIVRSPKG
mgnify:CR=1 FL=1